MFQRRKLRTPYLENIFNGKLHQTQRLTPNRSDWRVLVRVEKMWDTLEADVGEGLSFLFVDETGTKMHAFVEQSNQRKRFKRCLHEGEWKILTGFSVVMVNTEIRLTEARNKIALTSNTSVTPAEDSDAWIPLDIVPYDYVSNFWNDERTSFPRDFLGFILEVRETMLREDVSIPRNPLNDDPKTTNTIDFTLQDNDGDQIQCRVKGALASKFKRFWLYYGKIETIVCLLTDWRVLEDADPAHIESEEGISRFEFNPIGFDEVDHFTEIMCSSSQDSSKEEVEEMEFDYFNGCRTDNKS
ncbi:unnamed protein product [Microthlaspi erraticum]|uniref:Replication protein A 70 kDa DNA-binding subunit B/D first OB fold domain-containing protein n=1 Tax=Microthlaspi erraticum TaxID=1685480 RepID=A0A6D2IVU8_9BRAS|nr:unnamed protein product [Microthlaspi erraticum]